jgi:arabinogalactan oligomer/maltooligosaccharide transport system substrate-binding protein
MKKKIVALFMALTMTASLAACGSTGSDSTSTGTVDSGSNAGSTTTAAASTEKQDVALRMWGAEEDQTMLQEMIDSFIAEYSDYANITVELGVESEADAKDDILTDIEAAPDVFAMASDQIPDLVNANALQSIDSMDQVLQAYAGKSVADVESANSEGSVTAATYNDTLYAFPMTADNGYFLFYDSSIVSEEDAKSWDTLLAAADAAGKKVGMTLASGWYNASFFYGAGFTTGLNDDGTTTIDWNGTADYTGVEVTQAMLNIAGNSAFLAIADGDISNQIASGTLAAVVSGVWDATAAQAAFGDGYAATKLPTYTVGDKQVQQGSVIGCKVVGVNALSKNVGWAVLLADWITNEENQIKRFDERELGPSNINAASSDAVASNLAISALAEQSEYGVIQSVGGKFWDPTATFGENIAQGKLSVDDEAAIQDALDTLVEGVTAAVD